MPQCSALNCKNRGKHIFPKDAKRRKRWETALRIKNFKASKSSQLCADHFKEDDYFGKSKYTDNEPLARFLKKTAIPSIFNFNKPDNPGGLARQKRLEDRCQRKLIFEQSTIAEATESHSEIMEVGYEELVTEEVVTDEVAIEETISDNYFNASPLTSASAPEFISIGTQVNHEHVYGSINRCKDSDDMIRFYTGFESYRKFYLVYSTLSPMAHKIKYYAHNVIILSTEDQFFFTLMKLRQNKCNFELSKFFNVSESTVSNIFITWINFIHQLWKIIDIWPRKDLVQYYMPQAFKKYDPNLRVISDGTEIKVQKPKNPKSQQASWSSYKHANTLKILVGATSGGLLSYCSQAYAGSISDRQTVERSDLITKCESGDSILADRGFTVQDMFVEKNVRVNIPTFLKGKSQLPGLTVLKDRELVNKRVHIERIIGLTKTYKILPKN